MPQTEWDKIRANLQQQIESGTDVLSDTTRSLPSYEDMFGAGPSKTLEQNLGQKLWGFTRVGGQHLVDAALWGVPSAVTDWEPEEAETRAEEWGAGIGQAIGFISPFRMAGKLTMKYGQWAAKKAYGETATAAGKYKAIQDATRTNLGFDKRRIKYDKSIPNQYRATEAMDKYRQFETGVMQPLIKSGLYQFHHKDFSKTIFKNKDEFLTRIHDNLGGVLKEAGEKYGFKLSNKAVEAINTELQGGLVSKAGKQPLLGIQDSVARLFGNSKIAQLIGMGVEEAHVFTFAELGMFGVNAIGDQYITESGETQWSDFGPTMQHSILAGLMLGPVRAFPWGYKNVPELQLTKFITSKDGRQRAAYLAGLSKGYAKNLDPKIAGDRQSIARMYGDMSSMKNVNPASGKGNYRTILESRIKLKENAKHYKNLPKEYRSLVKEGTSGGQNSTADLVRIVENKFGKYSEKEVAAAAAIMKDGLTDLGGKIAGLWRGPLIKAYAHDFALSTPRMALGGFVMMGGMETLRDENLTFEDKLRHWLIGAFMMKHGKELNYKGGWFRSPINPSKSKWLKWKDLNEYPETLMRQDRSLRALGVDPRFDESGHWVQVRQDMEKFTTMPQFGTGISRVEGSKFRDYSNLFNKKRGKGGNFFAEEGKAVTVSTIKGRGVAKEQQFEVSEQYLIVKELLKRNPAIVSEGKRLKEWAELSPSQQKAFQKFLREKKFIFGNDSADVVQDLIQHARPLWNNFIKEWQNGAMIKSALKSPNGEDIPLAYTKESGGIVIKPIEPNKAGSKHNNNPDFHNAISIWNNQIVARGLKLGIFEMAEKNEVVTITKQHQGVEALIERIHRLKDVLDNELIDSHNIKTEHVGLAWDSKFVEGSMTWIDLMHQRGRAKELIYELSDKNNESQASFDFKDLVLSPLTGRNINPYEFKIVNGKKWEIEIAETFLNNLLPVLKKVKNYREGTKQELIEQVATVKDRKIEIDYSVAKKVIDIFNQNGVHLLSNPAAREMIREEYLIGNQLGVSMAREFTDALSRDIKKDTLIDSELPVYNNKGEIIGTEPLIDNPKKMSQLWWMEQTGLTQNFTVAGEHFIIGQNTAMRDKLGLVRSPLKRMVETVDTNDAKALEALEKALRRGVNNEPRMTEQEVSELKLVAEGIVEGKNRPAHRDKKIDEFYDELIDKFNDTFKDLIRQEVEIKGKKHTVGILDRNPDTKVALKTDFVHETVEMLEVIGHETMKSEMIELHGIVNRLAYSKQIGHKNLLAQIIRMIAESPRQAEYKIWKLSKQYQIFHAWNETQKRHVFQKDRVDKRTDTELEALVRTLHKAGKSNIPMDAKAVDDYLKELERMDADLKKNPNELDKSKSLSNIAKKFKFGELELTDSERTDGLLLHEKIQKKYEEIGPEKMMLYLNEQMTGKKGTKNRKKEIAVNAMVIVNQIESGIKGIMLNANTEQRTFLTEEAHLNKNNIDNRIEDITKDRNTGVSEPPIHYKAQSKQQGRKSLHWSEINELQRIFDMSVKRSDTVEFPSDMRVKEEMTSDTFIDSDVVQQRYPFFIPGTAAPRGIKGNVSDRFNIAKNFTDWFFGEKNAEGTREGGYAKKAGLSKKEINKRLEDYGIIKLDKIDGERFPEIVELLPDVGEGNYMWQPSTNSKIGMNQTYKLMMDFIWGGMLKPSRWETMRKADNEKMAKIVKRFPLFGNVNQLNMTTKQVKIAGDYIKNPEVKLFRTSEEKNDMIERLDKFAKHELKNLRVRDEGIGLYHNVLEHTIDRFDKAIKEAESAGNIEIVKSLKAERKQFLDDYNDGKIMNKDGSDVNSVNFINPKDFKMFALLLGHADSSRGGGIKPIIIDINNKKEIFIEKTALIKNEKIQKIFDANSDLSIISFDSSSKEFGGPRYGKSYNYKQQVPYEKELADGTKQKEGDWLYKEVETKGKKTKKIPIYGLEELTQPSQIKDFDTYTRPVTPEGIKLIMYKGDKTEATLAPNSFSHLIDKTARKAVFNEYISKNFNKAVNEITDINSPEKAETEIAKFQFAMQTQIGRQDITVDVSQGQLGVQEMLAKAGVHPSFFEREWLDNQKREYIDPLYKIKVDEGGQGVLAPDARFNPSEKLMPTLYADNKIYDHGQIEVSYARRNDPWIHNSLFVINRKKGNYDERIHGWHKIKDNFNYALTTDGKKQLERVGRQKRMGSLYDFLVKVNNKDSKIVEKTIEEDFNLEIGMLSERAPHTKPNSMLIVGLKGFRGEGEGNVVVLNRADVQRILEGDYDIDTVNYLWRAPKNIVNEVAKMSPLVKDSQKIKEVEQISYQDLKLMDVEDMIQYKREAVTSDKAKGTIMNTQSLVQHLQLFSSVNFNFRGKNGKKITGPIIKIGENTYLTMRRDLSPTHQLIANLNQHILDAKNGYDRGQIGGPEYYQKIIDKVFFDTKSGFFEQRNYNVKQERLILSIDKETIEEGAVNLVGSKLGRDLIIRNIINPYRELLSLSNRVYEAGSSRKVGWKDLVQGGYRYSNAMNNAAKKSEKWLYRKNKGVHEAIFKNQTDKDMFGGFGIEANPIALSGKDPFAGLVPRLRIPFEVIKMNKETIRANKKNLNGDKIDEYEKIIEDGLVNDVQLNSDTFNKYIEEYLNSVKKTEREVRTQNIANKIESKIHNLQNYRKNFKDFRTINRINRRIKKLIQLKERYNRKLFEMWFGVKEVKDGKKTRTGGIKSVVDKVKKQIEQEIKSDPKFSEKIEQGEMDNKAIQNEVNKRFYNWGEKNQVESITTRDMLAGVSMREAFGWLSDRKPIPEGQAGELYKNVDGIMKEFSAAWREYLTGENAKGQPNRWENEAHIYEHFEQRITNEIGNERLAREHQTTLLFHMMTPKSDKVNWVSWQGGIYMKPQANKSSLNLALRWANKNLNGETREHFFNQIAFGYNKAWQRLMGEDVSYSGSEMSRPQNIKNAENMDLIFNELSYPENHKIDSFALKYSPEAVSHLNELIPDASRLDIFELNARLYGGGVAKELINKGVSLDVPSTYLDRVSGKTQLIDTAQAGINNAADLARIYYVNANNPKSVIDLKYSGLSTMRNMVNYNAAEKTVGSATKLTKDMVEFLKICRAKGIK